MTIHKTALRLPKDLHQLILNASSHAGISMNAEIVTRLKNSFERPVLTEKDIRQIAREEANRIFNEKTR